MLLKLLLNILQYIYLKDLLNYILVILAISLFFKLTLQISLQFKANLNILLVLFN